MCMCAVVPEDLVLSVCSAGHVALGARSWLSAFVLSALVTRRVGVHMERKAAYSNKAAAKERHTGGSKLKYRGAVECLQGHAIGSKHKQLRSPSVLLCNSARSTETRGRLLRNTHLHPTRAVFVLLSVHSFVCGGRACVLVPLVCWHGRFRTAASLCC